MDGSSELRENIAFARYVVPDLVVDLDFVAALADQDDPGWAAGCTESDWRVVARVLVSRLIAKLREVDGLLADDASDAIDFTALESDMRRLSEFLGDEFSDRVVSRLAAALRDTERS
jgi:hypothetical protein